MPHDEDGQATCTRFLQSQFPLTAHSASIAILVFKRHVFFHTKLSTTLSSAQAEAYNCLLGVQLRTQSQLRCYPIRK